MRSIDEAMVDVGVRLVSVTLMKGLAARTADGRRSSPAMPRISATFTRRLVIAQADVNLYIIYVNCYVICYTKRQKKKNIPKNKKSKKNYVTLGYTVMSIMNNNRRNMLLARCTYVPEAQWVFPPLYNELVMKIRVLFKLHVEGWASCKQIHNIYDYNSTQVILFSFSFFFLYVRSTAIERVFLIAPFTDMRRFRCRLL